MRALVPKLDIKLYGREKPGNLFTPGGDLDGRLKVILDGLRIPQSDDEAEGFQLPIGERYLCLLEDDSLIRHINIESRHLLTPPRVGEGEADIRLTINVDLTWDRY